jgi:hypothetical protein
MEGLVWIRMSKPKLNQRLTDTNQKIPECFLEESNVYGKNSKETHMVNINFFKKLGKHILVQFRHSGS